MKKKLSGSKRRKPKLAVHKETVARLGDHELAGVLGGAKPAAPCITCANSCQSDTQ